MSSRLEMSSLIKNERELKTTKSQLKYMREALKKTAKTTSHSIDEKMCDAAIKAMNIQISDLEEEIKEYEGLKEGSGPIVIDRFEDLPIALIKARIARNLTQKELAGLLHMKPQQIQRYEHNEYYGVALHRIIEIAKVLGIRFVVKPEISVSGSEEAIA